MDAPEEAREHAAPRADEREGSPLSHLVAGVMFGAAVAALLQLVLPEGALRPIGALLLATICVLCAWKLGRAADVADAAGLAGALAVPFYGTAPAALGLVVAALALFVTLAQRGRSPLALLAAATFFVGARHAAGVDLLLGEAALPAVALFLALVAYGALVVALGRAGPAHARAGGTSWTGPAAALVGVLLLLTAFPVLDAAGVTDPGIAALALGALIGGLLAVGLALDVRALAATMGVILPLAILSFALLALGPALAAVMLLALGGALLWHTERLRGYLRATS